MRITLLCGLVAALSAPGCAHRQLRESTLRQATTITELRYGQVLDNLAMAAAHPDVLPYFAIVADGTAQVQNNAGGTGTLEWDPFGLKAETLTLTGSHTVVEQWGLDPTKDPERLEAMRCAYRYVSRGPGDDCSDCLERLHHFKLDQKIAAIPPGFFHAGYARDVPKHACYVGKYHHKCVWVTADGVEALTRLTPVILDIATADLDSLDPPAPTKTVERSFGPGGILLGYKEVTKEPVTPAPTPAGPRAKRRENYPNTRQSITTPRPQ